MSAYSFVDTTEAPQAMGRPAEAVCFNGVWLDDEIEGFRTLNVSGREVLDKDIDVKDTKSEYGETFQRANYPPRTISVTYQLITKSDEEFREQYNKLNGLLSENQAKLVFADEPDKYFIATKSGNDEVDEGLNSVKGIIKFYCPNPLKYSTVLKESAALENSDGILEATIVNNGTVEVPISYEITHSADNGYIGIVSENGAMQYGSVEEADGVTYKQNECLLTHTTIFNTADDVDGVDAMHPAYGTSGSLTMRTIGDKQYLGFGSEGTQKGSANGGLRTITIPADSEGNLGAKNFYSWFHVVMYAGLMGQTGEMCINWITDDGTPICGVNWYKTDMNGNTGHYELLVYTPTESALNGHLKVWKSYKFECNHIAGQNPWAWDWGYCDLRKEGSKLTFYYKGTYPSIRVPEIEDMVCTKVQISIKAWKGRTSVGSNFLNRLGLYKFYFHKMNVEKWKDVPNRYSSGDVLRIDGDASKAYVNEMIRQSDEVRGTTYFKAPVGESKVQFYCSSWVTTKPTIKAYIREAYL